MTTYYEVPPVGVVGGVLPRRKSQKDEDTTMRYFLKRTPLSVLTMLSAAVIAATLLAPVPAVAQIPSFAPPPAGWLQATRPTDLSVTSSSSNVALGAGAGPNVLIYNTGSVAAYVRFGVTAPTAVAATGTPVAAGGCAFLRYPVGSLYIGAITVSGSTTLKISTGTGAPTSCATSAASGTQTVANASQYPLGATPITGNSTGTTGAVVGSLTGAASVTTYVCGFNVQAIGGTATVGPITIAGLVGSSQVYQTDVNSATVGKTVAAQTFSPCIPASAVNTAITATTTANGTATAVDVNMWGYRQ